MNRKDDIISSVLPETMQDDYPTGFSIVGHVGKPISVLYNTSRIASGLTYAASVHLNLREEYLPYKYLIAEVLLDKNHNIRTVINKTDEVGARNEYRTFSYELLAGDPDLNVEINEQGCTFRFDYSKVYWNSRLNTEHKRLVDNFKPGEAICDVMAGVGPFAVPAGRKQCWVFANDMNPESFKSLRNAIKRNKVS